MSERKIIQQLVIEPGTGKALEVLRGQMLRIEQVEGAQCADFNCFNLHDYKEYMHTGRTRHMHGLHPTKGDFLWSAPPRERPMAYVLEDTVGTNDALYPRCSAFLFEFHYGLPVHTNCHDIQAEAQRDSVDRELAKLRFEREQRPISSSHMSIDDEGKITAHPDPAHVRAADVRSARTHVFRQQHAGSHEQDRFDAREWLKRYEGKACRCPKCLRLEGRTDLAEAAS